MLTSRIRRPTLILLGCILSILLCLAVLLLFDPSWNPTISIGGVSMDFGFAAFLGFNGCLVVAYLISVIQGFRVHWGWGVANMLFPFSIVVFMRNWPRKAIAPMVTCGCGLVLLVLSLVYDHVR